MVAFWWELKSDTKSSGVVSASQTYPHTSSTGLLIPDLPVLLLPGPWLTVKPSTTAHESMYIPPQITFLPKQCEWPQALSKLYPSGDLASPLTCRTTIWGGLYLSPFSACIHIFSQLICESNLAIFLLCQLARTEEEIPAQQWWLTWWPGPQAYAVGLCHPSLCVLVVDIPPLTQSQLLMNPCGLMAWWA